MGPTAAAQSLLVPAQGPRGLGACKAGQHARCASRGAAAAPVQQRRARAYTLSGLGLVFTHTLSADRGRSSTMST